ncbi:MAG: hypothetical protein FJ279_29610 [Planctomycetes bacterium]|nr:hypothetical protein [Planctomycetota bacterium]
MGIGFVYRSLKISAVVALLGAVLAATYGGFGFAAGFLCGAGWNILNLLLITWLVQCLFAAQRSKTRLALLLAVKFPLLYGGGFALLAYGDLSVYGVLTGFSIPLIIVALKAAGAGLMDKGLTDSPSNRLT